MNGVFKYAAKSFLLFICTCNLFTSWSSVCVNLVCDCLERENVLFFFFSYFYLFFPKLPYSRPPLPQIVPREKRRGAMGCKCVLTFLLLPAGVTVDASASWMLRRVHTHRHTYDIRVYVCGVDASSTFRGSYLRIPPRANFAPRAPSCLLPSFDPTTFSHISSHPP